jgi:hypothetical protein
VNHTNHVLVLVLVLVIDNASFMDCMCLRMVSLSEWGLWGMMQSTWPSGRMATVGKTKDLPDPKEGDDECEEDEGEGEDLGVGEAGEA